MTICMYISPLLQALTSNIIIIIIIAVVPPRILSLPQFGNHSFINEQVTLTVTFQSHQEATTMIRWFKNDFHINSTSITTRYSPAPNATTELHFEQITRENRGYYRVEIENMAKVIPADMRTAIARFSINVQGN